MELICLHTSIAIISTQLNGFKYCDLTLLILFNINHLFREKFKDKVIQEEEFNVKESQCYNISVLMNHHQDEEG